MEPLGGATSMPEQTTPAAARGSLPPPFLARIFSGPTLATTDFATSRLVRISISELIMFWPPTSTDCTVLSLRVRGGSGSRIHDIMHHQLGFRDVERRPHEANGDRAHHPQAHKRQDEPFVPEQGDRWRHPH